MRIITYALLFIIILLGISFATLNPSLVNFNYYVGQRTFPLSLLLAISFISGCVLGLLVGFFLLIKLKIKIYSLQTQLKIAEKEVINLRAIPLQDRH
ncbi:MAG: lapA [Gammaproteobacteria bacterium]|nr:lapA [Gammaproteobacteria bacterium]